MKIDLHLHTKKCKQGDGSKRNINPKDFIRKMSENNVGICAITNHNHFDIETYEKILEEEPEFVVFPGIELDIKSNNEQHHIIVICDPEKRTKFNHIFDNDPSRDYDSFYLEYDDFIEKVRSFNPENIIVIPHFLDKDKKRALDIRKKDKLINDLVNYSVILEPGRLQTMGVINAHNELSLIGSDVKDWSQYDQAELPEIKFKISSFKKFYELAKNPTVFINTYLSETQKYLIPAEVNKQELENPIEIYKDINIIFGEKGSGKTILLKKHIYPFFVEEGINTYLHEGKDYNEQYDKILRDYEDSIGKNEEVLNEIESIFNHVIKYNESKPLDFIKLFKRYHSNIRTNKRAETIKKTDSKYSNNYTANFESILDKLKTSIQKVNEVKRINDTIRDDSRPEKGLLSSQLNLLNSELVNLAIKDYKKIFISENVELFLTTLKDSIQKKTGEESKPNNIGFAKIITKRLERAVANNALKIKLEEIKDTKTQRLGYIPNKGNLNLVTSIEVLKPNESYNDRKIFKRHGIKTNRSIIEKIDNFNIENFKKINDCFELDEIIEPREFTDAVIKKTSVTKLANNNEYTPSEGEKAIITISGLLENDSYDCYLFDEIERGLGQKYITDYIIPKLKEQRDKGKVVIVSTHNSNIAINTLPSQTIYCDFKTESLNAYYLGNLYTNKLTGVEDKDELNWKDQALTHLEGSREMFGKRRNIYGI